MATTARASCIFPAPLSGVWAVLRDFAKTPLLIPSVNKVDIPKGQENCPGVVRTVHWKTGDTRSHRLLEISDLEHSISWELVAADPPLETMAVTTRMKLYRVSEDNTTMVEWEGEFAADTPRDFILFEQKAYQHNLNDIRSAVTSQSPPLLYHILEGPSTRVLWTAAALAVPLRVRVITPAHPSSSNDAPHLYNSQYNLSESGNHYVPSELSSENGGVVTCLQVEGKDGEAPQVLYESGTAVMYLIERYDRARTLSPFAPGTPERAKYLQWFFYSTSTADHLLFEAYKQIHVLPAAQRNESLIKALRQQWDLQIVRVFERALATSKFLCGESFTGADIMAGWSVQLADVLGWLEGHPLLEQYLAVLRTMPLYTKSAKVDPASAVDCCPFYVV